MKRIHILMFTLQAWLLATARPFLSFHAEAAVATDEKLETLQARLIELHEQMKAVQAKADSEKRGLTTEEETAIDDIMTQFDACENEIERRTKINEVSARMSAGRGRQTDATNRANGDEEARPAQRRAARTNPSWENDKGKWGFDSLGQFAQVVKGACMRGGSVDPRLIANAAPTHSSEGSGADGGFAIPPDFRSDILQKVQAETSLISRTDGLVSSSNQISLPVDETTPWQTSGGIQAYWEGEAAQHTASKVALESRAIRLNKLTAMVNITDELLEDAPALGAYIRRKAPIKIDFKITDGIVRGTGAGMPMGLINAACKVRVAKETSQTAATIQYANIVNMWARLYAGSRPNAVWIVQQDLETALMNMSFPGTGTAVPVYLPPGGLSASPYGLLLGKPMLTLESASAFGTEGDIILTDLTQYMTATKIGGIRQEMSIHLYFDYDIVAFKFVVRVAGQPWWGSSITPKNSGNNKSCIVTLADRL